MRVLFFTKYTRLGASSRLRTYQYLPYFEEQGIVCEHNALFNNQYLESLYQKKSYSKFNIIKAYFHRLLKLLTVFRYDLVVIEKELFPYLPAIAERILSILKVKYVVDYDDAIFHNYDLHSSKWVRAILGSKIAQVMKGSFVVVAGNSYLQAYAQKVGAKNVIVIPTVINTDQYDVKEVIKRENMVIGWIGSPTTLKYVKSITPVLHELSRNYPIKLHIVGGKGGVGIEGIEEIFEWSEDSEVELIRQFDIGIMPLKDDAWEKGKCGYKLIQYMGCGLPVVGSPIGVNDEIIQHGVNGFKAFDLNDWKKGLESLLADESLRNKMGRQGRKEVEEKYSLQKAKGAWLRILLSVG